MRSQWSAWSRRIGYAAAGVLLLLCIGDATRAQSVGNVGIDPLAVLDLQVKPAAIVILDSSGSMRERPECVSGCTTVATKEAVGDDPDSKLWRAKSVLRNVISRNQGRVRFMFGRYGQTSSSFGPENPPLFYSTVCDPAPAGTACRTAADAIRIGTSGGTSTGLTRAAGDVYDAPDGKRHYYMYGTSKAFYNNDLVLVQTNGSTAGGGITAFADTPPAAFQGPTFRVQNINSTGGLIGSEVTFTFRGIAWDKGNTGCGGFQSLVGLQPCSTLDVFTLIGPHLNNEVPFDANGNIQNYNSALANPLINMPFAGIRASGSTPIADSLAAVKTEFQTNIYPVRVPGQRTFVIFVTDGDDTCGDSVDNDGDGSNGGGSAADKDDNALQAAGKAELLHDQLNADPTSSVTTYVINFGASVSGNRSNWIAWGGSGMKRSSPAGSGNGWMGTPPLDKTGCPTCVDAFLADNEAQLDAAIQSAIDRGQSTGEFAASPTITEAVYEYGTLVGINPLYPGSVPGQTEALPGPPPSTIPKRDRYRGFVPIVIQPTFDVSNFGGKVSAFSPDGGDAGTDPDLQWEASAKLAARLGFTQEANFFQLHAGSTPANIGSSAALIKRRIYTSSRNGVFSGVTQQTPARLWPPSIGTTTGTAPDGTNGAIAPNSDTVAGWFDDELGIVGVGPDDATKFADLQTRFGACKGTIPVGHPCDAAQPVSTRYQRARREAREMVLAYTAGASVSAGANGPARTPNAAADILYIGRLNGLMAESTLSVPAVITPPLEDIPTVHSNEYLLFRDGTRNAAGTAINRIDEGFGLRNPDKDRTSPSFADAALKPVMTVAYVATNQMLHALRAGACPPSPTNCPGGPAGFNADTGGEELWGFVPYDQLGKLVGRMFPQLRDPHTYAVAASPRFVDVFVPGPFTLSDSGTPVTYSGKWRTLLLFGRGIGGKHLTALDVTVPGPYTRAALASTINPPLVYWNRGNPDTIDGLMTGPCASEPASRLDHDTADCNAYRTMGQTWSVPAVVRGNPAANVTSRTPGGVEFVAYVGSGFSDVNGEGRDVYALDVLTGDVIASKTVGQVASRNTVPNPNAPPLTLPFPNAVVANAAAFVPGRQGGGFVGNSVGGIGERVYISDIHGRVWRFTTSDMSAPAADRALGPPILMRDLGDFQPVTTTVGLLNFDSDAVVPPSGAAGAKAHLYVETGGDRRVKPPGSIPPFTTTPPFKMFGLRDENDGSTATLLFEKDLNPLPTTGPGFRGTVSPAVVFNDSGKPRVFFAGTQLTPPGANCSSRLDSILFVLTGVQGDAAYDLNNTGSDEYILFNNGLINSLQVVWQPTGAASVSVSQGLGVGGAPPKPPSPPDQTGNQSGQTLSVYTLGMKMGSPVCR